MKPKVYLAGRVWEVAYRNYVKKEFGDRIIFLDPMTENGVIVNAKERIVETDRSFEEVVESDKALINNCDIFIAIVNEYSAGTMMEIIYAYMRNKPVYIICPEDYNFHNDIWIKYHANRFFHTIDECYNHIIKQVA